MIRATAPARHLRATLRARAAGTGHDLTILKMPAQDGPPSWSVLAAWPDFHRPPPPGVAHRFRSLQVLCLRRAQSLIEVCFDVLDVLNANGNANVVRSDPGIGLFL